MHIIKFSGKTDIGLVRANNEDTYRIDAAAGYCLVADGMGGAAAGETASRIFSQAAGDVFKKTMAPSEGLVVDVVREVFVSANDRILAHVDRHPEHQGMGCTAELLVFTDAGFVVGHMGDSRTYRLRQGKLKQLTKDHSLVQEQIDKGYITAAQARTHAMRNIILRAVGVRPKPEIDTLRGQVLSGDLFLLCSDGLTDPVEDPEIVWTLTRRATLEEKAEQLVELAKGAGSKDNITVVLVAVQ